jgi:hypothetical protein
VCDGTSHLYAIGGARAESIDRFELPRKPGALARFAGRLTATAPTTFSRMAASPEGDVYVLDQSTGLLWQLGAGGWITGELGGPGDTASWTQARDVATDSGGDLYVLDHSLCTVRRFSRDGVMPGVKPLARFGRKANPSEKDGLAGPVALAGTPAGAAGRAGLRGDGAADFIAVLLRERVMGIHVFLKDGAAQPPFPGENDGRRQGSCIAIGADGNVHVGSAGLLETFSLDGRVLRRTKLPVGEPASLASSADGAVCVLDAGRRPKIVVVSADRGQVAATFDVPRTIRSPVDVACDGYGTLYLLDGRARRIHLLRPARATSGAPTGR